MTQVKKDNFIVCPWHAYAFLGIAIILIRGCNLFFVRNSIDLRNNHRQLSLLHFIFLWKSPRQKIGSIIDYQIIIKKKKLEFVGNFWHWGDEIKLINTFHSKVWVFYNDILTCLGSLIYASFSLRISLFIYCRHFSMCVCV